ncbi:LPS-assembly protein [Mariprofundus micogutta]|uniref:LPS-assembly protein LptD n=1 Tax=Mariprofundus micogutta TaxID=1921010 RepID=A0A1L8CM25_9PROT|nr:LPS assembly protein LptD [Mariprofundus micogutta]GAV19956.1 LPS-assembly protein [Mariprofundus micogutta]
MLQLPRLLFIAAMFFMASTAYAAPVDIAADEIARNPDGTVVAKGNVIIKRVADILYADEVIYRTEQQVLEARGHVVIESPQATIRANEAVMNTGSQTGNILNAVITLPGGERLQAARLKRIDDQTFEAEEIIYSACPINEESWRVRANHALLDQQDGSLTTTDARFELWQVPVLYAPWWQQPLRRKSGLLMPSVGSGNRRGTEIGLPFYFAPAESWDATLTPRWMSARGFMGEAEFRHASSIGTETMSAAGINDTLTARSRVRLQSDIHWHLPAGFSFDVEADHVSDSDYLADFGTEEGSSTRYLQSSATLSQSGIYDNLEEELSLTAQHQQDLLLTSNATTLQILPRLQSSLIWPALPSLTLGFEQQTTRFDRRLGVDGWRMVLHPFMEIPLELAGGGISAKLHVGTHHTRYWLKQLAANAQSNPSRTTAEASLEVRSDFEGINSERTWRHAISPILRYDFVSAPDQSNLPNFDSTFGLLSWSNLMSGNRFSGFDRIEKANRFSLVLENRLQHKVNPESAATDFLVVRAGASYSLQRQTVDAALKPAATRPFSNLLAEITFQPASGISMYSSGQYNTVDRYWATISSAINLNGKMGNLTLSHQLTDARYTTESQLLNVAASLRLGNRWLAKGSWQYDHLLKISQYTSLGMQYQHPCWKLGAEGYRINRRTGTAKASNLGFRILLEFKGLGSVGS